jgi:hypothetical protein
MTAMHSNGGTPQQNAATTFMLLVMSSLIPLLFLLWYTQESEDDDQQLAVSAEEIARTALRTIRISRGQSEGCGVNEEQRRKKPRLSSYSYERARLAIEADYFSPTPLFNDRQFERIFCVTRSIVEVLIQTCGSADPFFTNVQDVTGRYNISPVAKVLVALKQIAYGCSPSAFIDYFQMSETPARRSMIKLSVIVASDDNLQSVYGRQMTRSDARRLSALHEACHGVAGMVGSLDCTHVGWKNCPVAWQGSNAGRSGKPTIVLKAMADHNLWFWHHSFGWPGSLNDINIWNRSCLLKAFLDGSFARDVDFEFTIGEDKVFNRLWILVDGIYPELSRFVKTLQEPVGRKACRYAVWQESARKDIERAFGVLQRKFRVLVGKNELWYVRDIGNVVKCCLCLHNMMVATRMAQDEEESEEFYAFPGLGPGDDTESGGLADEEEQVYVNRRVAEMQLHAQLYETNNEQDHRITDRERQVLESLRFQYVQRRWECLYDLQEHHRLRDSIMKHIET